MKKKGLLRRLYEFLDEDHEFNYEQYKLIKRLSRGGHVSLMYRALERYVLKATREEVYSHKRIAEYMKVGIFENKPSDADRKEDHLYVAGVLPGDPYDTVDEIYIRMGDIEYAFVRDIVRREYGEQFEKDIQKAETVEDAEQVIKKFGVSEDFKTKIESKFAPLIRKMYDVVDKSKDSDKETALKVILIFFSLTVVTVLNYFSIFGGFESITGNMPLVANVTQSVLLYITTILAILFLFKLE